VKEDFKKIIYVGLGALSETNDKMKELSDGLYKKGKELYEKGVIANEELKHNINEAMKENVTVVNVNSASTKEDIIDAISKMSLEDQEEILNTFKKSKKKDKEDK